MNYDSLWETAVAAGKSALDNCVPTPVGFYSADLQGNRLGETDIVEEGLCGGAYIVLSNFRDPFVKWMKANHPKKINKNYPGKGYTLSTHEATAHYRGQSFQRYEACADAMVKVLSEAGVACFTRSYLT